MADGRKPIEEATGTRETNPPPFSREQFESSPEFASFKVGMTKLLRVTKVRLDELVLEARADSPRWKNPGAPGRKRKSLE